MQDPKLAHTRVLQVQDPQSRDVVAVDCGIPFKGWLRVLSWRMRECTSRTGRAAIWRL